MKYNILNVLLICVILVTSCKNSSESNQSIDNIKTSKTLSVEDKVEALLSKMTLEEKIGQMNQYNGFWDVTGPAP